MINLTDPSADQLLERIPKYANPGLYPDADAEVSFESSLNSSRTIVKSYSKYQQNIIKNYYENRDAIALQKAQELVTELYLSTGKKRQRCWERLSGHLAKLGVPQSQIEHLVAKDNPELVAKTVEKLIEKSG
jgi:hypothetical protein